MVLIIAAGTGGHGRQQLTLFQAATGFRPEHLMTAEAERIHYNREDIMENKTVKVPNINCMHCVHTIESELSALPYIKSVHADLSSKEVRIEWEQKQNWSNIVALLKGINYPPQE